MIKQINVSGQHLEIILIVLEGCCVGCKLMQAFAGLQGRGMPVPSLMMASSGDLWD